MNAKRKQLIEKFQKWLDTSPAKGIIAAQCANIAEEYAKELLEEAAEKIENLEIHSELSDSYKMGYNDCKSNARTILSLIPKEK